MKKLDKYFTVNDTCTKVTYLGEFLTYEDAYAASDGTHSWLNNHEGLAKLIASAFEAFNIGMNAEPPKPDTDTYKVRCTMNCGIYNEAGITKVLQAMYDQGNIAGTFRVEMDTPIAHIEFQRSLSEDQEYIQTYLNKGYNADGAAVKQIRTEFKHMASSDIFEPVRSTMLEALTEVHECDVRWPPGCKFQTQ